MLAPKMLELSSAAGLSIVGFVTATAAPVMVGVDLPFFSPMEYAAAVAGAGTADLWRLIARKDKEPSPDRIWRNAMKGGFTWLCGSLFGLFLGSVPATFAAINAPAGAFIVGFMSNGIMTALVNPEISSKIAAAVGKFIGDLASKHGRDK